MNSPESKPIDWSREFTAADRILSYLLLPIYLLLLGGAIVLGLVAIVGTSPIWVPIWTIARVNRVTNGHPLYWLRAKLGWGRSPQRLAEMLNVSTEELNSFRPVYVEAFIKKRKGGSRRLQIPDEATKDLQRRLLHRVFSGLRAHPAAMGFEQERSIVENALPHVGQAVVIQMDVEDFFPSTTAVRVEAYFRRIGWNRRAAALLTRLTTDDGGLPQGAPTSPRLSNLVNYGIDERLARFAKRRKGQYTRYADDITFSFPKDYPKRIRGVIQKTKRILKANEYRMHERRKLHIRRRHQRQMVTGLVVNERANLPRHLRRRLRAAIHRHRMNREATWSLEQLQGWAALTAMIERQSQKDNPD